MKKLSKYHLMIIFLLVVMLAYFLLSNNVVIDEKYSYMGNKSYEQKINTWLDEKQKFIDEYKKNKTPEQEKKHKNSLERVANMASSRVQEINFYGKVIDQFGNPVNDATVIYSANSGYLAEGSGRNKIITNSSGSFEIIDVKGISLSIQKIEKEGYEFKRLESSSFYSYKRFTDSLLWNEYTQDNPFVLKAWKVDHFPKIKKSKLGPIPLYGFIPDGREYTLNFLLPQNKIKNEGIVEGDITVTFQRTDEQFTLILRGIDGGLQESSEIYMNFAPEFGYENEIQYTFNKSKSNRLVKKFYFVSRENKFYGRIEMTILPYFRNKSVIEIFYVVNMENGRDLAIKVD